MSEPVTKEQYEFYRSLYEQEERTSLQLEGRAKVYLGIISAFLAAILLKAGDAKTVAEALRIPWILLLLESLSMSLALLLVLWALRIRQFEVVNDGSNLIELYTGRWPSLPQFYEDRIIDYAVASSRNRLINNETAKLLSWAGYMMAMGILTLLAVVIFAIRRA